MSALVLHRIAAVAVFFVCTVGFASAQTLKDRAFRVEFPRGQSSITIREEIRGAERVIYRLSAKSGQMMDLKLTSTTRLVEFAIYAPDAWPGGKPFATSNIAGALVPDLNRYGGRLSATGDFRIVIRHLRDFALAGQRSNFRLDINITGGAAPGGGIATQLPGDEPVGSKPGYWRVTGLKPGDMLNVRTGPSTANRVIDRLSLGEVVRNEGCATSSGVTWCEVSRVGQPRLSGWASAAYLAPSGKPSGDAATQLPGDAVVPGTKYNATGTLSCRIDDRARTCGWGVIRRGRGDATLYVTLPSREQRRIDFQAGRPISANRPGGVFAEYTGNGASLVTIGPDERYTVEDAILFGG